MTRDREASTIEATDEIEFSIVLRCPSCGGDVVVSSNDRGARCGHCDSAHLVMGRSAVTTFVVPNRIASPEEARRAFVEDLRRRRLVELSMNAETAGEPLDPIGAEVSKAVVGALRGFLPGTPDPASRLPEAILEADAAAWADKLDRETSLKGHLFFLAPYWHLTARLYEGIVGRSGEGKKIPAASTKTLESSRNAFADDLAVPNMGTLSHIKELRPITAADLGRIPILPPEGQERVFDELSIRQRNLRLVRELSPLVRSGILWPSEHHLIFRPFHLVTLECRGRDLSLLLDGYAKSVVQVLTPESAARISPTLRSKDDPPLGTELALRPMKCSDCGWPLPLDRTGEIRFCPTCGRAMRVVGERLQSVPHQVHFPLSSSADLIFLPFWRFRFEVVDPRDRVPLRTLTAIKERLGNRSPRPPAGDAALDSLLDVPAFRPLDRRRAFELYQKLFAVERPLGDRAVDGPIRVEMGFPRPARFVSILEDEAAALSKVALLLLFDERDLINATPERLRQLLIDPAIGLSAPSLVLRAFHKLDVAPIQGRIGWE